MYASGCETGPVPTTLVKQHVLRPAHTGFPPNTIGLAIRFVSLVALGTVLALIRCESRYLRDGYHSGGE